MSEQLPTQRNYEPTPEQAQAARAPIWPGDPTGDTYEEWDRSRVTPSGFVFRCYVCGKVENCNGFTPQCGHDHPTVSMQLVEVEVR